MYHVGRDEYHLIRGDIDRLSLSSKAADKLYALPMRST